MLNPDSKNTDHLVSIFAVLAGRHTCFFLKELQEILCGVETGLAGHFPDGKGGVLQEGPCMHDPLVVDRAGQVITRHLFVQS